jgi:hypothetical protein
MDGCYFLDRKFSKEQVHSEHSKKEPRQISELELILNPLSNIVKKIGK